MNRNLEIDMLEAEAEWLLAILPSEQLPDLAQNWLCQHPESKSILDLAICELKDREIIEHLFLNVIDEYIGSRLSIVDSLRIYACRVSKLILSNNVKPTDGAKRIWAAAINAKVHDFHELDPFIYAASEIDDRPEDKEFFERAIIKEAELWTKFFDSKK